MTRKELIDRERVRQCEELGEYATSRDMEILRQEQDQIDLPTALGEDVTDVSKMKG